MSNIPFKSKLSRFSNTKNRNKKFHSLTNKEKRREIAFDALSLILVGKIDNQTNGYWEGYLKGLKRNWDNKINTPEALQEAVLNIPPGETCSVCERGAIMLSTIRLGNTVEPDDDYMDDGSANNIQGFSMIDMRNMEKEYEDNAFNHEYYSHTLRKMANILCNVIKNGNFKTGDTTDYLVLWEIKL